MSEMEKEQLEKREWELERRSGERTTERKKDGRKLKERVRERERSLDGGEKKYREPGGENKAGRKKTRNSFRKTMDSNLARPFVETNLTGRRMKRT